MKRVIIFYGNELCYNTLNVFAESVASNLENRRFEVNMIDAYTDAGLLCDEVEAWARMGKVDAAISLNVDGRVLACRDVLNSYKIPLYDWILDHPCDHIKVLEAAVDDLNAIVLDRDHAGFITRHIENIKTVYMIPLGGILSDSVSEFSEENYATRRYGLIFTGSYVPFTRFEESILSLPDRMKKMTVLMIEYMLTNRGATNEEALNHALREVIGTDEIPSNVYRECAYYTSNSNVYVRHFIREEVMRYIVDSGVPIDIFGPGWELPGFDKKKNVVLHDRIDYMESVKVCGEAKLSLNIMPWFKDGLHDRIPTAMINGSAVATDKSRYIDEVFNTGGEEQDIFIFDIAKPETIPEYLNKCLGNEDRLYHVAKRGRDRAMSCMTWGSRVDELIEKVFGGVL